MLMMPVDFRPEQSLSTTTCPVDAVAPLVTLTLSS
jgi:hypothetical protein